VAQFGEEGLALPGDQEDDDLGDVLAYLIPALALLLGGAALAAVARRVGAPYPALVALAGAALALTVRLVGVGFHLDAPRPPGVGPAD
jgi:hypothetical protein